MSLAGHCNVQMPKLIDLQPLPDLSQPASVYSAFVTGLVALIKGAPNPNNSQVVFSGANNYSSFYVQ
jgi:hypothetical protein